MRSMSDAKKKILHIEDDKNVQLLVRMILERAGFAVSTAVDAMQGLMLARQLAPDLIVLDIMMPAGGGASVHERIRQLSGSSAVPILIYSATDPSDILKKVPADPLTLILQKPAPPAMLIAAVERLFSAAS
jgi:two-component system, chemotaxis family, chemotaxis protein CheY